MFKSNLESIKVLRKVLCFSFYFCTHWNIPFKWISREHPWVEIIDWVELLVGCKMVHVNQTILGNVFASVIDVMEWYCSIKEFSWVNNHKLDPRARCHLPVEKLNDSYFLFFLFAFMQTKCTPWESDFILKKKELIGCALHMKVYCVKWMRINLKVD